MTRSQDRYAGTQEVRDVRQRRGDVVAGFVTALISTLVIAIAGTLPWGLPEPLTFVAPMITIAAVFYWSWVDRRWMPVWLAFSIGLLTDLLSQGPFGYWSLLFVIGHTAAVLMVSRTGLQNWFFGFLTFGATTVLLIAIGWAVASLYFLQAHDWQAILMSGAVAFCSYPFVSLLLSWMARALSAHNGRMHHVVAR